MRRDPRRRAIPPRRDNLAIRTGREGESQERSDMIRDETKGRFRGRFQEEQRGSDMTSREIRQEPDTTINLAEGVLSEKSAFTSGRVF